MRACERGAWRSRHLAYLPSHAQQRVLQDAYVTSHDELELLCALLNRIAGALVDLLALRLAFQELARGPEGRLKKGDAGGLHHRRPGGRSIGGVRERRW